MVDQRNTLTKEHSLESRSFVEVFTMMGAIWFFFFCFIWLMGFSLLAEIWFYEEEQEF